MMNKQQTSSKVVSFCQIFYISPSQNIVLHCSVFYVTQVFSGCGKPLLGRRRRDTTELEFESLQFGRSEDAQNGESNIVPTLDKLVKDIRQKVQCSMYYFYNL
jgi:hypothetical protein